MVSTVLAAQPRVHFATDYFSCFSTVDSRLHNNWSAPLTERERRFSLAVVRDQFLRVRHPILVSPGQFSTLDELHRLVMNELTSGTPKVIGHKLLLSASDLERTLASSSLHILLMIRDPRDSSLSFLQRTGGGVESYIANWLASAKLARRLARHPRLLALKFEDLILNPKATLERLGRWLAVDVRHDVAQLHFRRNAAHGQVKWRENSAFGDVQSRYDTAPLHRYRSSPSASAVRYAQWATRSERWRWGYKEELTPPISRRERLEFLALRSLYHAQENLHTGVLQGTTWCRKHLPSLTVLEGSKLD